MSFADDNPGYRINTTEEAQNAILELVAEVERARTDVDIQMTLIGQRKAWSTWMVKHGSALGALMMLHRCDKVGDVLYNQLRERVMKTMVPTVTETPREKNRR